VPRKPVDAGNGRVVASFAADGSWLAVSAPHPVVGLVELSAAPPFPADQDGVEAAVRRHRTQLADPAYAVVRLESSSWNGRGEPPTSGEDAATDLGVWVADRTLGRECTFAPPSAGALDVVFSGRLDRPGYAEITPVSPPPPGPGPCRLTADGTDLTVLCDGVDPPARATVRVGCEGAIATGWILDPARATCRVVWDEAAKQVRLTVSVTIGEQPPSSRVRTGPVRRRAVDGTLDRVALGSLDYVLGCTALDVGEDLCCIVTDHRLLPLSWTRDAYYQAALLLSFPDPRALDTVRRHLRWLWGPGCDASGRWQRSHLTSGAVKDLAFQSDQQLYPILEACDYRLAAGRWPSPPPGHAGRDPAEAWGGLVRRAWTGLPRDPNGLLPGEENPADDAATYPYLLSSQLLLAYVGQRLADVADELRLDDLRLAQDSVGVLTTIRNTFEHVGPYGPQWAYEVDGSGGHRLYHDANDVPLALAPLWRLCSPDDPVWAATVRFGSSPHNPGYVPGRLGGLGSAHTAGVWPLGDAQAWAVAAATGDDEALAALTEKIANVAADDGMLPETYDPESGQWLSRHWFGWPGALVGTLHRTVSCSLGPWAVRDA
jgi:uncharacterized protein